MKLDRREFLRQAAAAGFGGLFGRLSMSQPRETSDPNYLATPTEPPPQPLTSAESILVNREVSKTKEEIFSEAGLEKFLVYSSLSTRFKEKFGAIPFHYIGDFLEKVATGEPVESGALSLLSEGWGTKSDYQPDLQEKIDSLDIRGGTPSEIDMQRQVVSKVSKILPYHILSIADRMTMVDGGGTTSENVMTMVKAAQPGKDENAIITLIHESEHSFQSQYWRVKPYITMEKYAKYLETYIGVIESTLDQWKEMPERDALSCKYGQPLLLFYMPDVDADHTQADQDEVREKLESWERSLLDENELKQQMELQKDWSTRFSRVTYLALRKAESNKALLDSPSFRECINAAVDEISHFFVGPVQSPRGSFPNDEADVVIGSFLTWQNIALQQKRFALFSPDFAGQPIAKIRAFLFPPEMHKVEDSSTQETADKKDWTYNDETIYVGDFIVENNRGAKAFIRLQPDTSASPIYTAGAGSKVEVYGVPSVYTDKYGSQIENHYPFIQNTGHLWVHVRLPTGQFGWIADDLGTLKFG